MDIPRMRRRTFLKTAGVLLATAPLINRKPRATAEVATFDPSFGTASQAVRAIRARIISARELTEHTYNRIKKYNPQINAFITLIEDQAMARASQADAALAAGNVWGPLHGLPILIKDQFSTAGVRTTSGSKRFEHRIPKEDAVAVARLKQAGAIIIGKTNLPEFAADQQSYNEVAGTTNNPWDVRRTPGGSSGGGAAALAAGLGFLELASDIGGSIRNPCHFCGIYGHKTTLDVVPGESPVPPAPGLVSPPTFMGVAGPMARSAQDLQFVLAIIGGPAPAEAVAYRWSLPTARGTRLNDYRMRYVLHTPFCPLTSEVADVLSSAIDAVRKQGVELREGWPPGVNPEAMFENYYFLLRARAATTMKDEDLKRLRERGDSALGYYAKRNLEAVTSSYRDWAMQTASRLKARAIWQDYFKNHDAFLMPGNFVPAFPHDHHMPLHERMINTPEGKRPYLDLFRWMAFATLTGCPATVAPVGRTPGGLPVGMQIMGPYLEDATPINIAGLMADVVGGFEAPPGYA